MPIFLDVHKIPTTEKKIKAILNQPKDEFQAVHGFRKFFKSHCEQVMKSINVEILMGHTIGVSDSYYKPTEKEVLEDYLNAVDLLTINNNQQVLEKQITALKETSKDNEYIIRAKLQEKDEQIKGMQNQIQTIMDTLGQIVLNQNDKTRLAKDLIDKEMYISK